MKTISKKTLPLFFLAFSTLAGCTVLDAVRIDAESSASADVYGIPYTLSYQAFDIEVHQRLAGCVFADLSAEKPEGIVLSVSAKASAISLPDPERNYRIDVEALQSFFKTTELTVKYHDDGSLASVNAQAVDKASELVSGVIKGAVDIFAAASGVQNELVSSGHGLCTDQAVAKLESLAGPSGLKARVKQNERAVAMRTRQLERLVSAAKVRGDDLSDAESMEIATAMRALSTADDQLEESRKKLEDVLSFLTVKKKIRWPESGEEFSTLDQDSQGEKRPLVKALSYDADKKVQKWLKESALNESLTRKLEETAVDAFIYSCDPRSRKYAGKAVCEDVHGSEIPLVSSSDSEGKKGLKYRIPALGTFCLVSRQPGEQSGAKCGSNVGKVIVAKDVSLSQLGPIYVLPLKSRIFTNKTVGAEFDKNGMPTMIKVADKAASDKLLSTFQGVVNEYSRYEELSSSRELRELEAKTKLLTAQKEYESAVSALNPPAKTEAESSLEVMQAETTLLQAELANLKARHALNEARQLGQ